MSDVRHSGEIFAFLCSTSERKKLRVVFHKALPAINSKIQIGAKLFRVIEIVHPLNLYGDELHGDGAIEVFVRSEGGDLYADAAEFEEVPHSDFL